MNVTRGMGAAGSVSWRGNVARSGGRVPPVTVPPEVGAPCGSVLDRLVC